MSRPPRIRTHGKEDRGQSEPIGVALLLGITILGSITILGFGAVSLDSARTSSQMEGTGHALTQLDSQIATVALGESDVQQFSLGRSGSGSYSVRPEAGWINISHINRTGGDKAETILNKTFGGIVYQQGNRVMAYQGGGVWLEREGGSIMVSPPEFHYRSATLTLPLIRVSGSDNAAGTVSGRIVPEERSTRIFPNASQAYSVGSGRYQNPVVDGRVTVTIRSDYYQAWAEYFRTRSSGEVTVHDSNNTVKLLLLTTGTLGDFDMPAEGDSIDIRDLGQGHNLDTFTITLFDDEDDSANFDNLKWSLSAEQAGKRLEIHVRDNDADTGSGVCSGGSGEFAELNIYYANQSGNFYQAWRNDTAFQFDCETNTGDDYNDDGDTEDVRLVANFTSETPLTYTDTPKLMVYDTGGDTYVNPTTFESADHGGSIAWEPETYTDGDEETANHVTNHYMSIFAPNFDLEVNDKSGNTVNEAESHGTLEQSGAEGNFLTFLHITETEIRIEFD